MAISDISLTAGMRSNLVSLQGTVDLLNRTQERLATGKKVNSPLDNATNYFVAKSHMDRAGDLSVRKDGMGEAIQTVKAANAGISAITDLIASAKGIAQSALSAGTAEASTLAAQFNSILDQIDTVAADSGYKGTNLLSATAAERSLTVKFDESGDSSLTITGSNATTSTAGLNIADAVSNWSSATNINTAITALDSALTSLRTSAKTLSSNLNIITTRDAFTQSMINVLSEGATNLTAADTNEEGANMLMLQVRQSLGTTALSLSAQAAQSVLRLF
jgi:flagellin-like hook-associated protein FlgL